MRPSPAYTYCDCFGNYSCQKTGSGECAHAKKAGQFVHKMVQAVNEVQNDASTVEGAAGSSCEVMPVLTCTLLIVLLIAAAYDHMLTVVSVEPCRCVCSAVKITSAESTTPGATLDARLRQFSRPNALRRELFVPEGQRTKRRKIESPDHQADAYSARLF